MASGTYTAGLRAIMQGNIDLINDEITVLLIDAGAGYVPDFTGDSVQADIPDDAQIMESPLTGKTITAGLLFLADDLSFSATPSGTVVGAAVILKDTGAKATSTLLAYLEPDTSTASDGGPYTCRWDRVLGIFNLTPAGD